MKKILKLLVCLSAIILCVSCSSISKNTVPSQETVMVDIIKTLSERNTDFKINNTETVKSVGEGNDYEITTRVDASVNYADWTFEFDLTYKKYDQGWMIEKVETVSEAYKITGFPEASILIKTINEDQENDYNVTDENAFVETDGFDDTGAILLNWSEIEELTLFEKRYTRSSSFEYDPNIDTWVYKNTSSEIEIVPLNVDLTGKWNNRNGYSIEFVDFSWEGFTLSYNDVTEYFFRISNHPEISDKNAQVSWFWYTNGNGIYGCFDAGRSEFVLTKGLGYLIISIHMDDYKSKIKYNHGTYELDDISNKTASLVTIKADDKVIIKDVFVRIDADNGVALAKDAVEAALKLKNISYKTKKFAGYDIVDKIDKYDTGDSYEYLWILYVNGEEANGRYELCEIQEGDRIELIREKY